MPAERDDAILPPPASGEESGLASASVRRKAASHVVVALQIVTFLALMAAWQALSAAKILDPFFFSRPSDIALRIWEWLSSGFIWEHLAVTLIEALLAFALGTLFGVAFGLAFARVELLAAVFDPYIRIFNALPRVILAPIFAVWFGLGVASKVALGVTLVFFIVFFNVYQGVKEVSPVVLANARMLGASRRQLLRHVYVPSATSWMFSSLHTSVGLAFVGAVVGEYLGSSRGVGYLILQAEGTFDINTVMAGILVLTAFALALDAAVGRIERRLLRWQPAAAETEKL